jgi:hypothetical protein
MAAKCWQSSKREKLLEGGALLGFSLVEYDVEGRGAQRGERSG